MEKVLDKFLRYVSFDTQSDDNSASTPSTLKQLELQRQLVKELNDLGLETFLSEGGVVYSHIPSNISKKVPTIGFIAHVDTSPDASGKNVKPRLVSNYDGQDILLNEMENIIMKVSDYPYLKDMVGQDLLVTDGTTLLGADDKAGVAVIMQVAQLLTQNPSIPHGDIKIAFTPDEEVGRGVENFDVKGFACDFAYTIDGGSVWAIEYENFNAASAKVEVLGRNIHPGSAKNKMINSVSIAAEFNTLIPSSMTPEQTEGYEGFFHVMGIKGSVEKTEMIYIIRNHDLDKLRNQEQMLLDFAKQLNDKYHGEWVKVDIKESYKNMRSLIEDKMYIVDIAKEAVEAIGYTPVFEPIRGGTDGASLTYMGLPCPNLGAGGYNFHGRYEFLNVNQLNKSVELVLKIIDIVKENKR